MGQQVVLAVLTAVGSYSFVSTVMVVIRRHYFSKQMENSFKRIISDSENTTPPGQPEKESATVQGDPASFIVHGDIGISELHNSNDGNYLTLGVHSHEVHTHDTLRLRSRVHIGYPMPRVGTLTTLPSTERHGVRLNRSKSDLQATASKDRGELK